MMNDDVYFRSIAGYFWQWEEEGNVIAIPNSSTIAYRQFVIEVMGLLRMQGLPPFGSLLLTIIATNNNGDKALDDVYALMDTKLGSANNVREPLKSAIVFLKLLAQLPKQYKQGKLRILLLQLLFENCHNRFSPDRSDDLYTLFVKGDKDDQFYVPNQVFPFNVYNNDFKVISLLSRRFPDQRSIIDKLAEVPEINEELAITVPETADAGEKDLIDQLIDNSKTFHVGSLVKRLWSGLNIPHHNMLPSRQPMGGVSDLTNKGEFDRLLISEFANDDLVFLSRLANNEALYINREIPPQNNDLERIILIDVSLKNWGTPRTIAHALMLAIAKHPKTDIHCSAFAVGERYHPLSWETADDVVQGLQVLEACLHPAKGLEAFFNEYGNKKNIEVFFISSQDTYRVPALHKTICDHYKLFNYWVHTDDKGNIDLYKRQQNNRKHVQHLLLPLEELWSKRPAKAPAEEAEETPGPVVYPILFADPFNPRHVLTAPNGEVFLITAEKALLRIADKKLKSHGWESRRGWELLYEHLQFTGGEVSIGLTTPGQHILLLFNLQNRQVVMMNIETGLKRTAYFTEWRSSISRYFIFHEDRFYFVNIGYPKKHWTFKLEEEIVINAYNDIPKAVLDIHNQYSGATTTGYSRSCNGGILKKVHTVFVNQVNNIVFNHHELRLTDHKIIKLEISHFLERVIQAELSGRNTFKFADGSSVTIHQAGLLIFKSSNPMIDTFYIPSVLDMSLGAASGSDFTGNTYFQPVRSQPRLLSTDKFWRQYMEAFIEHILKHGA